ncbi:hypothetical protein MAP00_003171 [Monascus purpureus]|nr:hypothetical protein MAP00_003171 [Monascus purpureus]
MHNHTIFSVLLMPLGVVKVNPHSAYLKTTRQVSKQSPSASSFTVHNSTRIEFVYSSLYLPLYSRYCYSRSGLSGVLVVFDPCQHASLIREFYLIIPHIYLHSLLIVPSEA